MTESTTQSAPAPQHRFDLIDWMAMTGFVLTTIGLALWSVPLALTVDGIACLSMAGYMANLRAKNGHKKMTQLPK